MTETVPGRVSISRSWSGFWRRGIFRTPVTRTNPSFSPSQGWSGQSGFLRNCSNGNRSDQTELRMPQNQKGPRLMLWPFFSFLYSRYAKDAKYARRTQGKRDYGKKATSDNPYPI